MFAGSTVERRLRPDALSWMPRMVRYRNAETDAQRGKIEWMSEYVNETIAEQRLPSEWKVALPDAFNSKA